jgi:predicted nucleic acid-binding protein
MILLDTSAWIEILNRPQPPQSLPDLDAVATCGPVLQEVLQGVRDVPQAAEIRLRLLALPLVGDPLPVHTFCEAADVYRRGRRQGYSIRSSVDCLIAAIAIENGLPVWHCDRDFDLLAKFTPLRAVRFPARVGH